MIEFYDIFLYPRIHANMNCRC